MKETTINEYDHVDVNDTNTKCIQISIHYSNLCMTIYCKILQHQKYNQISIFMKREPP